MSYNQKSVQLFWVFSFVVLFGGFFQIAEGSTESRLIQYDGQANESFELTRSVKETRFRTEQREGVCTRQVPYQEQVCGNETRYRQECQTIPGREECNIEQERRCHTVTRYREECRNVGGGQDCRRVGGEETCRTVNGRRVCTRTPVREVCTPRPVRRVCERVPYSDVQCDYYPRRVCRWVPPRQDCRQIPYQEYVCRDVTRYREESYACMRDVQIPYEVDRHFVADVEFLFNNSRPDVQVDINSLLNERGEVQLTFKDNSSRQVIVTGTRNIKRIPRGDDLRIEAKYKFDFLDYEKAVSPFSRNLEIKKMKRKKLEFVMGPILDEENLIIHLTIESKNGEHVWISRQLLPEDMKIVSSSKDSVVKLDLVKLLGKKLESMTTYRVAIEVGVRFEGEVLNYKNLTLRRKLDDKVSIKFK